MHNNAESKQLEAFGHQVFYSVQQNAVKETVSWGGTHRPQSITTHGKAALGLRPGALDIDRAQPAAPSRLRAGRSGAEMSSFVMSLPIVPFFTPQRVNNAIAPVGAVGASWGALQNSRCTIHVNVSDHMQRPHNVYCDVNRLRPWLSDAPAAQKSAVRERLITPPPGLQAAGRRLR